MKAYEEFLGEYGTWVAGVAGVLVCALLLLLIPGRTPEEKAAIVAQDAIDAEWYTECSQLSIGTSVTTDTKKVGGLHFCLTSELIEEYPLYDFAAWDRGCKALGGVRKFQGNESYSCYQEEIVKDLGPLENFGGTP